MTRKESTIDYILVEKKQRKMSVYHNKKLIKSYTIALGPSPVGHKKTEGDGKTPEGTYYISSKNPKSKFHLSLQISYPNEKDQRASPNPGGNIMIHGLNQRYAWLRFLHTFVDWTQGCIAVTNDEIEEIFGKTNIGTRVDITP